MNAAELAFAHWQASEELTRQAEIVEARAFFEGDHDVKLTARQLEFLGISAEDDFSLNMARNVVTAVEDRLIITGMQTAETGEAQPVADWAWEVWQRNRGDALQSLVHEGTPRDGEYFAIVDWEERRGIPRFYLHPRYAGPEAGGDGFGMKAHYAPGDTARQSLLYASKRWTETVGSGDKRETRQRLTLYYPDRVEKYVADGEGWKKTRDEGDTAWPIPLEFNIVAHFKNRADLRSDLASAIPIQRAMNKSVIDLLAAADMTGFGIYFASGFLPTTDGLPLKTDLSNAPVISPGQVVATLKENARFGKTDGSDPTPLINLVQSYLMWLAMATNTPLSRFSLTKQVMSEGSQKESNEAFFAKIRKRQTTIGNGWEDAFDIGRKWANLRGGMSLSEAVDITPQWEPVQARSQQERYEEWRVKRELGVPLEMLWQEIGYTPEQIAEMKLGEEYLARVGMMQLGLSSE